MSGGMYLEAMLSSHCLSVMHVMGRALSKFCWAIKQKPRTVLSLLGGGGVEHAFAEFLTFF
jgi:hypothetical protein